MTGERARRVVLVSGRVQGVYFRDSTRAEALAHGVAGEVENLADGRVRVVFEGARAEVEEMVAWCGHGPPAARVEALEVHDEEPEGLTGFRVLSR